MKRIMLVALSLLAFSTGWAQALQTQTMQKFQQFTYTDNQTGKTMEYNLFIPDGYDEGQKYPLLLFIADASTVGKEVTAPLTQGYGALLFASEADQAKHPSFILVPQYTTRAVNDQFETSDEVEMTIRLLNSVTEQYSIDKERLYTTGQSMGGMMSLYFNIAHPDLFAASLFVGCQWDTDKMEDFGSKKFFYIVAGGDEKASTGMHALQALLAQKEVMTESASWSARLPQEEQDRLAEELIAKGCGINFIEFIKGTVLPENGEGIEHMYSFDYAYKLTPVRDWLFQQVRQAAEMAEPKVIATEVIELTEENTPEVLPTTEPQPEME